MIESLWRLHRMTKREKIWKIVIKTFNSHLIIVVDVMALVCKFQRWQKHTINFSFQWLDASWVLVRVSNWIQIFYDSLAVDLNFIDSIQKILCCSWIIVFMRLGISVNFCFFFADKEYYEFRFLTETLRGFKCPITPAIVSINIKAQISQVVVRKLFDKMKNF